LSRMPQRGGMPRIDTASGTSGKDRRHDHARAQIEENEHQG
jgi:hypothetical protein